MLSLWYKSLSGVSEFTKVDSQTKMNTLTLQRQSNKLERIIKTASRALLEFEVAQSKWERSKGIGKVYTSVGVLMRDITKKIKHA